MIELNCLQSVSERDIDMILVEELQASEAFRRWFSTKVFADAVYKSKIGAWHSVSNSALGESDIVFLFVTNLSDFGHIRLFERHHGVCCYLQPAFHTARNGCLWSFCCVAHNTADPDGYEHADHHVVPAVCFGNHAFVVFCLVGCCFYCCLVSPPQGHKWRLTSKPPVTDF